jgi:hypothetical protein
VDIERVADELYALPLKEYTATRDARASEAREAGETALAASLKAFRKPTVSAWLANLLARERTKEVDRLIALGAELRNDERGRDGDLIRRVSKERTDAVSRLVRDARTLASWQGQTISEPALVELQATLDAAFADQAAADSLRAGRLTTSLQYSGLGLAPDRGAGAASAGPAADTPRSGQALREAERNLQAASRDAARADADVEQARRAVGAAEKDLTRLKAAVVEAQERAKVAHKKAATAEKNLTAARARRRG